MVELLWKETPWKWQKNQKQQGVNQEDAIAEINCRLN